MSEKRTVKLQYSKNKTIISNRSLLHQSLESVTGLGMESGMESGMKTNAIPGTGGDFLKDSTNSVEPITFHRT